MSEDKLMTDRRAFVLSAGLMGASLLAGCGAKSEQAASEPEEKDETAAADEGETQADDVQEESSDSSASKTLVIYYSRADENYADGGTEVLEVGHTKVMAGYIAEALGADQYEIVSAEAYPFSYDECCDQASDELKKDVRPALAGDLPDVSGYDTVFLGCPIWWGSEPMVVRTFLEKVDLSGKVVVPFTTHGGSGLGSVPANLQARIPNATFQDGKAVAGTAVDGARDEVVQWAMSCV
jgi:flavodoxin